MQRVNNKRPPQQKILYLIADSNWGGAQRYVYNIATNLPPTIRPVVAVGGTELFVTRLGAAHIPTHTVESFQRDIALIKEFMSLIELIRIIRRERPDIVHVNSSKAGGTGALAARLLGVRKIVFTIHGWPAAEVHRPLWQRRLIGALSWVTCVLAHMSITITPYEFEHVRSLPLLKNKIAYIPNGIEHIDHLSRAAARTRLTSFLPVTIPDGALIIGTIGELTHNKDHATMIESFIHEYEDDDNTFLVIVGDGELKHELTEQIKEHGAESRVILAGAIPDAYTILPAFDIFLFVSTKEGLPYALLEAGSASLPVIATPVGGIPTIITHDYSGLLVPPKNIIAIRDALRRLIDHPKERDILGHHLHHTVSSTFQLSRMVSSTLQVYTEET